MDCSSSLIYGFLNRVNRSHISSGHAGQALRLFLSYEYGARHEMTNGDMIMFLRSQNRDFYQIQTILDRCTDVEFAKGVMDEREFFSSVEYIHSLIAEP